MLIYKVVIDSVLEARKINSFWHCKAPCFYDIVSFIIIKDCLSVVIGFRYKLVIDLILRAG